MMVSGALIGERRAPDFMPHWLGDRRFGRDAALLTGWTALAQRPFALIA
jgi:hypothetical protein